MMDALDRECYEMLVDDVINGHLTTWDEEAGGWRGDLRVTIESILFDDEDDKIGRMNDAKWKYVELWAKDEVRANGFYAQKYHKKIAEDRMTA